ncbi:MAG: hypothetical protein KGL39_16630 [Patescibacteria group bacterium]|nr:hypothetical protein [Patescibacteria group bacterium]
MTPEIEKLARECGLRPTSYNPITWSGLPSQFQVFAVACMRLGAEKQLREVEEMAAHWRAVNIKAKELEG